MLFIGAGLVAVLVIGAIALLLRNDDGPVRTSHPGPRRASVTSLPRRPAIPSSRSRPKSSFAPSPGPINRRHREASDRAAPTTVRSILTDLYTEAFLDPANWEQGAYTDAFGDFAGGAKEQAEAHPGLLTAGARAGERYDSILPGSGRVATRILLDRHREAHPAGERRAVLRGRSRRRSPSRSVPTASSSSNGSTGRGRSCPSM